MSIDTVEDSDIEQQWQKLPAILYLIDVEDSLERLVDVLAEVLDNDELQQLSELLNAKASGTL